MSERAADSITDPPLRLGSKAPVLLLLVGLLVYANAFNKGFVLDDTFWITTHPNIGNAGDYIWRSAARPLVAASIVLNHRLGGLKPLGYHAFNVALHVLSSMVLFAILRKVFDSIDRIKSKADSLAFAVALLWLVHPLNTQAVAYIIQRAESMMGLFFLLGVYCWQRGSIGGRAWVWLPLALASFFLSCASKEVAVVWPILILVFDRTFLVGSWRTLLKQRWLAYLTLAVSWVWLLRPVLVASQTGQDFGIGFGLATTPLQYAYTETEVVWHYLRLTVWPVGQSGDYLDWKIAASLREVAPAAAGIALLVSAMLVALYFRPKLGFPALWCLLILAPTSTFVPINDVAFEHRMYLPLIGVLVLLVVAADAIVTRLPRSRCVGVALLAIAAVLLGRQTILRNEVYRGNSQFFTDVLAKRPSNLRAFAAIAEIKTAEGKLDEAGEMLDYLKIEHYNTRSFQLNRARWHTEKGEPEKARAIFAEMLNDRMPNAWRYWANPYPRLLLGMNRIDEAVAIAGTLTALAPSRADAFALLAAAEMAKGNRDPAMAAWGRAKSFDGNIGTNYNSEARRILFYSAAAPPADETSDAKRARERLRRFRGEQAYHMSKALVAFEPNPEPQLFDTLAMAADATGRTGEAITACWLGYQAAKRAGNAVWANALRDRLANYLSSFILWR